MHFTNATDGGYVGIEILCVLSLSFMELAVKPYAFSLANLNTLC